MTLDQIRIFLAVAARGHMTRAARDLNMTQSAVSAAVAALESQHGVLLFNRVGRGIELTAEGASFVPAARAVLAQAETAKILLGDLAHEPRGRLRIHASQTVASYWLPRYLVRLHETRPAIGTEMRIGNTTQVARAVQDGTADLGFVEGEVAHGALLRRVVARDELVLIFADGHPAGTQARIGPEDYRAMTWVLREQGSGTRSEFENHLTTMGMTVADLRVALEIPSNEAVIAAVAAGRYVSMVSRRAVAQMSGIRMRPVCWAPAPYRPFAVLLHPERHRTRAMEALLALLSEAAQP